MLIVSIYSAVTATETALARYTSRVISPKIQRKIHLSSALSSFFLTGTANVMEILSVIAILTARKDVTEYKSYIRPYTVRVPRSLCTPVRLLVCVLLNI